jgi:glycolate oxidase iron-sulfur subunit
LMSASLPVLEKVRAVELDPRTYDRALSCVHCGLCLPACPTYTITANEADSPRGRIQLMRGLAEGVIDASPSVREHLDLCLDCRACETACPSGVVYHELIEETRGRLAEGGKMSIEGRFMQWVFFHVFTHPTRLKLALLPVRVMQKIGIYGLLRKSGLFKLLPIQLRKMEQMLPAEGAIWPGGMGVPPMSSLLKKEHGRDAHVIVGFFAGCIGSVMFDSVNRMAVELLAAAGAEVVMPRAQGCCGAIHHHNGAHRPAEEMARRNIDAFLPKEGPGVDFIATNIAGCGAMLREYDFLLRDDPAYAERAKEFSRRVRDISEVLVQIGLPEMRHSVDETVTYHDACHLAHAQKVTMPPRELLAKIPGLKMVPLAESDMCCGAAGTYNLTQPEMATELAERKLGHIAATGAAVCVTGNAGCALHIQSEAAARWQRLRVVHPVELLHRAVFGVKGTGRVK